MSEVVSRRRHSRRYRHRELVRLLGEQDDGRNVSPSQCGKRFEMLMTPNCPKELANCERMYSLYIPTSLCKDNGNNDENGEIVKLDEIIPIVFAIHCYGCTGEEMNFWVSVAEEYNFVLVIPEGISKSFNAKVCCGHAMKIKVDDVGFFRTIIADLTSRYSFVSDDLTYAVGFSNGGYLASYAATLFRAIAPISGYQYADDLTKITDNVPTGLFLHHASDDAHVRFGGCCSDPAMPPCCCKISAKNTAPRTCTSATQAYDRWAEQVNGCTITDGGNADTHAGADDDYADTDVSIVSYTDEMQGIVCHTRQGCQANTTMCVHKRGGHQAPLRPMTNQIASFFARDACEVYGNSRWIDSTRECSCTGAQNTQGSGVGGGALYCLGTRGHMQSSGVYIDTRSTGTRNHLLTLAMLLIGGAVCYRYFYDRLIILKRKYKGWKKMPVDVEVELLHM